MAVVKLFCPVMNYDWGRVGSSSLVARLSPAPIDESKPYAELWIGAHPKAQARVESAGGAELGALIAGAPIQVLGAEAAQEFGGQLPFLLKVLSIAKPLSIQAHPDRCAAAELHAADPINYPDENSKPEIAIALSEVELLSGLRRDSVEAVLSEAPELREIAKGCTSVRCIFEALMMAEQSAVAAACIALSKRLSAKLERTDREKWAYKLCPQYPAGDRGVLCFFLLNLERIKPGEAVFTAAGVPHAYLSGEILECMANSDNVVRAGLTAKHVDAPSMLKILSENQSPKVRFSDEQGVRWYDAGVREFKVGVAGGPLEATLSQAASAVLSLDSYGILSSKGRELRIEPGAAFFIPANDPGVSISLQSGNLAIARVNF